MTDTTAENQNTEAATETVIGSAAADVDTVAAAGDADTVASGGDADTVAGSGDADTVAGASDADSVSADTPFEGLTAPTGFDGLDAEALAAATPILRELGVDTTEKAQATLEKFAPVLAGLTEKAVAAAVAHQETQIAETSAAWAEQSRNHPTLGGANFEKSKTDAARFRDQFFASDEAKAIVRELPIFNHPVMFEAFAKAGRALASDNVHSGEHNAAPKPTTVEGALYGDMAPVAPAG